MMITNKKVSELERKIDKLANTISDMEYQRKIDKLVFDIAKETNFSIYEIEEWVMDELAHIAEYEAMASNNPQYPSETYIHNLVKQHNLEHDSDSPYLSNRDYHIKEAKEFCQKESKGKKMEYGCNRCNYISDSPVCPMCGQPATHERAKTKKLALLNTSILTSSGEYKLEDISLEQAKNLVQENKDNLDSAIGHQSTADIMTTLLETPVEMNRQMFEQRVGQQALVFKLNGRPEEGKILSIDDIESIGYKFQLLIRKN